MSTSVNVGQIAVLQIAQDAAASLDRLRRVRGASRRTRRRIARATAILLGAAALLGARPGVPRAQAATPQFVSPLGSFPIPNVGSAPASPDGARPGAFPCLADIDGDGDLDALVGRRSGDMLLFENTGSPSAPAFAAGVVNPFGLQRIGTGLFPYAVPELVDIDGDGDLDAFVGEFYGTTVFFENTGTASAPAFAAPLTDPFGLTDVGRRSKPAFADIDGDGDLDAFVGEKLGDTFFFENTGNATVPAFAAPLTDPFGLSSVGQHSVPELADIDGDGDLDAFVGELYGTTVFFENTGTASAPAFAPGVTHAAGLGDVGFEAAPELADIDGDGDLDALIGARTGDTYLFSNTGTATAPAFFVPPANPFGLADVAGFKSAPALADIDGDGDLDAFFGGGDGNTIFSENTGNATAPAFAAAVTNPFRLVRIGRNAVGGYAICPAFVDIDGDGDLDAMVGDSIGRIIYFRNKGTSSSPTFARPSTNPFGLADVGFDSCPSFVDIDGDGDFDALIGELYGNTVFFQNTGTPSAPAFAAPVTNPFGLIDTGSSNKPALADIDGDGDLDALSGEGFGNSVFFENTGTVAAPAFAAPLTNPFGLADVGFESAPALADIDGDGDLDAFIGEFYGRTFFFENQPAGPGGTPTPTPTPTASPTPTPALVCAAAPLPGCDVPQRSRLVIRDNDKDARDALRFKFVRGTTAREGSVFADPSGGAAYSLCVYDHGVLVAQLVVPPGPLSWHVLHAGRGFRYRDRDALADGTKAVLLRAGATGSPAAPRVVWKGHGALLPDPVVPLVEPVDVTAQVVASNGACFGDTFTTALRNAPNAAGTVRVFKAKKP